MNAAIDEVREALKPSAEEPRLCRLGELMPAVLARYGIDIALPRRQTNRRKPQAIPRIGQAFVAAGELVAAG